MTISVFDSIFGILTRNRPGLERLLKNVSKELEARRICQETRKELLNLTDEQLKDVGITKAQAKHEGNRGFWD